MKAQLTFDLTNEEDADKFKEIASGNHENLKLAISAFKEDVLRRLRKYNVNLDEVLDKETDRNNAQQVAQDVAVHIEERFYEIIEEYGAELE